MRNITEWAKQQTCWHRVESLNIKWPETLINDLITTDEIVESHRSASRQQRILNDIEAQTSVVAAGNELWVSVKDWGLSRNLLSQTTDNIMN